ncbi:MAG: protein kinase [Candidatus Aminicenantes bacterium]|nr:protein kinase [Candidatus Aminicenantes bacterium]
MKSKTENMSNDKEFPEIPGYRIEKKLGRGGMADVYLGVQETLDRKVAIKILNPEMMQKPMLLQRFLNEARTASRLEHPNIVTIHNVEQIGDTCCIIMEYLQESLVDRIKLSPTGKIEPGEAFRILKQVANALRYAHQEGFIHRDIKPDNILFRKDNTPVLVDFGIARPVHADTHLTATGMIIGTPHYMSPEQCKGEKIDAQSDLYSLGIVLYEMLTGCIPYKADSAAGILVKHIQSPVPQLSGQLVKYQPLLNKMVAKEKSQRVRSGEELLNLLREYFPESRLDTIEITKPEEWVFSGAADEQQSTHKIVSIADEEPTSKMFRVKKRRPLVWMLLIILVGAGGAAGYYFLYHLPSLEKKQAALQHQQKGITPVQEREIITETESKDKSKESDKAVTSDRSSETSDKQETIAEAEARNNKEYEKFFNMAEEYFKDGQIEKAREKLNQAKAIKETDDVKVLQKQINDYLEEEKRKEFNRYFAAAKSYYKKGNYARAKQNLAMARKLMSTGELETLARDIREKEEEARRKAQQERMRKRRDDNAFQRAKSRNTIYAYEKYLEKYPSGRHANEAQKRLNELKNATRLEIKIKDDVAFETAASTGTIAAYEAYLKEYPYGAHASEAKARVRKLKEKILKETKIKIELQTIKFFESGSRAQPLDRRQYSKRFSKQTTRYIFTEIKYKNKLYGIAASSNPVVVEYNHSEGAFKHQLKGIISPLQEARDGIYSRGMGWTDAGKWPAGSYSVTVYIDGNEVGKSRFEIY